MDTCDAGNAYASGILYGILRVIYRIIWKFADTISKFPIEVFHQYPSNPKHQKKKNNSREKVLRIILKTKKCIEMYLLQFQGYKQGKKLKKV